MEEQVEIVRQVEGHLSLADGLRAEIDAGLERLAVLRQAILRNAFSGQLVAQEPADEPASMLLERIRAGQEEESTRKRRNNKNGKKEAA